MGAYVSNNDQSNNNGKMSFAAIAAAAAPAVNSALGLIGQRGREIRSMSNQQKLMNLQVQNQMKLDKYGQDLQLDTWKKTNYPAQVEMLKEAGLNPALLYGNGGSGGVTGSQGGGSAASGNAPAPQPWIPLDISSGIKLMAELKIMEAQKENIEADTANKQADNPRIASISEIISETKEAAKNIIISDTNIKNIDVMTKTIDASLKYYLSGGLGNIAPPSGNMWEITENQAKNSITYQSLVADKGIKVANERLQTAEADLNEKLRSFGANNATIDAVVKLIIAAIKSK